MPLIPDETIMRIVEQSDIVETISAYVPLKRAGRNYKANCPFHNEKTPSFVVNSDKQIFHCFGCGVGGNVVSFIMKHDRLEFPEAVRLLAEKVNIPIPVQWVDGDTTNLKNELRQACEASIQYFHKILLSDKSLEAQKARDYLKQRKISLETAKQFQLGYAFEAWDNLLLYLRNQGFSIATIEKAGLIISRENRDGYYDRFRHRIIFPIFDAKGQCIAFGARTLEKNEVKYINSPETPIYTKGQHVYGLHLAKQAISQKDFVIIVEGYMDCLTPYQAGVHNIVASLGTALTVEQIRLLRRYTKNVVFLYDMDAAGEAAMMRSLDILIEEGMNVKVASLDEAQDPDSFVREQGAKAFEERIAKALTVFDYKLKVLKGRYDERAVEGKAKIASEMLPTINRFDDAVIRAGYLERLSKELNIPEQAITIQFQKIEAKGDPSKPVEVKTAHDQYRVVELSILKLLLDEEAFIPSTKEQVPPADFQDAKIRQVISRIYDLFDQGRSVSGANLMNSFEDDDTQKMVSGLLADETVLGDKNKIHHDYINLIKKNRIDLQIKNLVKQITEIEHSKKESASEDLLTELTVLKKEYNQLTKDHHK